MNKNLRPANVPQKETSSTNTKLTEDGPYRIRMYSLQHLLSQVLDVLAASLPNKQQHDAAVRQTRKAFDATYLDVLHQTDPDSEFGCTAGCYMLVPIP